MINLSENMAFSPKSIDIAVNNHLKCPRTDALIVKTILICQ